MATTIRAFGQASCARFSNRLPTTARNAVESAPSSQSARNHQKIIKSIQNDIDQLSRKSIDQECSIDENRKFDKSYEASAPHPDSSANELTAHIAACWQSEFALCPGASLRCPRFFKRFASTQTSLRTCPKRIVPDRSRAGIHVRRPANGRSTQKNARCKQRARIPVKEVSHELRVQNKRIGGRRQRTDRHIDIACASIRLHGFVRTWPVRCKKKRRPAAMAGRRWWRAGLRRPDGRAAPRAITARDADTLPCSGRASATTRSATPRTAPSRTSRRFPRCRPT